MNKIILIGHLGQDAEVKTFENGSVVNFSMATTENWNDNNKEKQSLTTWHNISCGFVALAPYLKKGSLISVEGAMRNKKTDDKYYSFVKANKIELLDKKEQ